MSNTERANRGVRAVQHYKARLLKESVPVGQEDLVDLLTDLRHWCRRSGTPSFSEAIEMSEQHYHEEIKEG